MDDTSKKKPIYRRFRIWALALVVPEEIAVGGKSDAALFPRATRASI